jgi:CIC family chloride channel protein
MGAGYDYMDQAMHNQFTWQMLGVLALLKIVSTTLSFVSGTPGGMFAPTLFIGAMLGGMVGGVERLFYPHLVGSVGTSALVGMGVLFAAFLRAPMTSVFMVLEVSGNYSIIVPVIVANTVAYVLARSLQHTPIFDVLTRQDGLELPSLEEEREQNVLLVEDAMRPIDKPVLKGQDSVEQAMLRVQDLPGEQFLVQLHPSGWNVVARDELKRLVGEGKSEMTLASVLPSRQLPSLFPDLSLEVALRHIYQAPLVPVVHRADPNRLVGVISREDVSRKYQQANLE